MELIRIGDSKLKVMLSAEDMRHYAIDGDRMDYANTETRRAIWQILDEAKQETGFDAAAGRLLIQAYPMREGGCELYVTRLPHPAAQHGSEEGGTGEMRETEGMYAFSSLERLLEACAALQRRTYRGESSAFLGEGEECYLLLQEPVRTGAYIALGIQGMGTLVEYGCPVRRAIERAYIREHSTLLVQGAAVQTLGALYGGPAHRGC